MKCASRLLGSQEIGKMYIVDLALGGFCGLRTKKHGNCTIIKHRILKHIVHGNRR